MELTEDYLREAEQRARRFSGAYTGTSGTLAADVLRLVGMIRRAPPRGDSATSRRLIGLTGPAGAGKDLVASLVPSAVRCAFADPIYSGLAAMFGTSEGDLRDRRGKELPSVALLGASPRTLLQTLGTDWGRRLVRDDVWVELAARRWEQVWARNPCPIVVPDVRFENEAEAVRSAGGEVWLIYRDVPAVAGHISEAGLPLRLIDRLVVNTGTVAELRSRVAATLQAGQ